MDVIFIYLFKGCLIGIVEGKDFEGLVEKGSEWWLYKEEFYVSSFFMFVN